MVAKDGVIENPLRCSFDPASLACEGPDCLTAPQVEFARKVYAGPVSASSKQVFTGLTPGSEQNRFGSLAGPEPLLTHRSRRHGTDLPDCPDPAGMIDFGLQNIHDSHFDQLPETVGGHEALSGRAGVAPTIGKSARYCNPLPLETSSRDGAPGR
jgi:hypothetical protein